MKIGRLEFKTLINKKFLIKAKNGKMVAWEVIDEDLGSFILFLKKVKGRDTSCVQINALSFMRKVIDLTYTDIQILI